MLYLAVMLGNIILLDVYNSLGLPTSTTVSLIFALLGAAIAVTIVKISGDPDVEAITRNDVAQLFIEHPLKKKRKGGFAASDARSVRAY